MTETNKEEMKPLSTEALAAVVGAIFGLPASDVKVTELVNDARDAAILAAKKRYRKATEKIVADDIDLTDAADGMMHELALVLAAVMVLHGKERWPESEDRTLIEGKLTQMVAFARKKANKRMAGEG